MFHFDSNSHKSKPPKKYLPFQNTYQLICSFPNAPFHKNQRTEETNPPLVRVSLATSPTCSSWLSTFWSDVLAAPGSQVFTFRRRGAVEHLPRHPETANR